MQPGPELDTYRQKLEGRLSDIDERISDLADACEAVEPDQALGRLTRTGAMQDQQVALHLRRQLEMQRLRVQTALERVELGTFGVCGRCKGPIDARRLELIPESPLCVSCLKAAENKK